MCLFLFSLLNKDSNILLCKKKHVFGWRQRWTIYSIHAIQNGGAEIVQFGQRLHHPFTHWIVCYTHTIDLLCKSAHLVHLPHSDRIKLWS